MRHAIAVTLAATLMAQAAEADPAGFSTLGFEAPHHGKAVAGAIWYPAAGTGDGTPYAENPVFQGVMVREDAPLMAGEHPIVMLSHGMGGEVRSLAWLGTALAERGAIVVGVNHPNTTWSDFDLALGTRHWTRAQDLSRALDTVLADRRFADQIDETRVMAAGFSYGGWTALSLGGLLGNHQGYVDHCAANGAASTHCDDMMGAEVRLAEFDDAAWNSSYADPRVSSVVAIDPGLVWGINPEDTAGLVDKVRLIGLGGGEDRMLATDFDTSGFAEILPEATIDRIVPAVHFTAMPLCKPQGAAILEDENDDPVCTDPVGTDRAAVHAMIIDAIAADLGL